MRKLCLIITLVIALISLFSITSAQEKPRPETALKVAGQFTIDQLAVGTGIKDRELVGMADSFPASTERVYCFLRVYEVTEDTEVTFAWYHGQNELLKTTLPLKKGARWRTFVYKNIYGQKGDWKVEIRDATGKILKEVKFKVE
ncbi:MAG: DUF2914 domain-containing protein [bacterium]